MTNKKIVKTLKMLKVNSKGEGLGLNTVKAEEATSQKIREFIGGNFTAYPFKMVYNGKKYWMCIGRGSLHKYDTEWFMPFTAGMIDVKFVYDSNNKPAHEEDLRFNGIQQFANTGQYVIPVNGPLIFIEDIGNREICSDYWEYEEAI